jgi:hypothetical protein
MNDKPEIPAIPYDDLPFHAIAEDYEMADDHAQAGMRESIRARGIMHYMWIWFWNGMWWLLDGRNRYVSAKAVGYKFKPTDFKEFIGTYEQAEDLVALENNLRGHHSAAQKQEIAKKLIARHPAYSTRRLAYLAGVSHTLIANLRKPKEDPGYGRLVKAWTDASYDQQERFCSTYRIDLTEMMRPKV